MWMRNFRRSGSTKLLQAPGVLLALLSALAATHATPAFLPSPTNPGPFPPVRPFTGEFRFGWSGIEAGVARAELVQEGSGLRVWVRGGTCGWVRALWRLDAEHQAHMDVAAWRAREFETVERYATRELHTRALLDATGAQRLRQRKPGPPARWKRVRLPELRDLVGAMLFIRSQPLRPGHKVSLPVFPGDSPFWVEVECVGRGEALGRPALKLDVRAWRLRLERGQPPKLEPHRRFRRAGVWISDDEHRLPLRAEAEVFVGKVYGELRDVRWQEGGWFLGRGFE